MNMSVTKLTVTKVNSKHDDLSTPFDMTLFKKRKRTVGLTLN